MMEGLEDRNMRAALRRRAMKEVIVKERRTWELLGCDLVSGRVLRGGFSRLHRQCRRRLGCLGEQRCSSPGRTSCVYFLQ